MRFYSVDPDGTLDLNAKWTLSELQAEAAQLHLPLIEFEEGKLRLGGRVFASGDLVDMYVDEMHHFALPMEQPEHWDEDYLGQDSADCDQWEARRDH